MAHVVVDARGVGPVGLDRDEVEAAPHDELLRDARAHPVELGRPVRRLAEQDDARVADALEQSASTSACSMSAIGSAVSRISLAIVAGRLR